MRDEREKKSSCFPVENGERDPSGSETSSQLTVRLRPPPVHMGFSLSPLCVCMLLGGAKGQVVTSAEYDPPVVENGLSLSLLLTRISWDREEEEEGGR